jgi:sugar phosphate isomerase/epimerase
MQIGIFAKTFQRPNLEATLDAVRSHGIDCVQFNFSCAGLPTLPEALDPDRCVQIRKAHEARGIRMAAVSGTFNLIHPNVEERRRGFWRLRTLAFACRWLGTSVITLSTGTRNATDLWSAHRRTPRRAPGRTSSTR